jgi:hypothetical protein
VPDASLAMVPFVGMGLTYHFKEQVYAGTIVRISDDFQSIFFVQDRPHLPKGSSLRAFIFTSGGGSACEARRDARGYVWEDRPVQLGVRRWVTTPLTSTGSPAPGLAGYRERFARMEPSLLQRQWYPMTYMIIPSLLRGADELIAEMDAYQGPDVEEVRELRERLAIRRAEFRREP